MILCSFHYYAVGEVYLANHHPIEDKEIHPPQPCKVIRHTTREEFISYWMKENPKAYLKSVSIYGEPDSDYYYEISTD